MISKKFFFIIIALLLSSVIKLSSEELVLKNTKNDVEVTISTQLPIYETSPGNYIYKGTKLPLEIKKEQLYNLPLYGLEVSSSGEILVPPETNMGTVNNNLSFPIYIDGNGNLSLSLISKTSFMDYELKNILISRKNELLGNFSFISDNEAPTLDTSDASLIIYNINDIERKGLKRIVDIRTDSLDIQNDEWTNQDIIVRINGKDNNDSADSIFFDYSSYFTGEELQFGQERVVSNNGELIFYLEDKVGNEESFRYQVKNIDKSSPILTYNVTSFNDWINTNNFSLIITAVNDSNPENSIQSPIDMDSWAYETDKTLVVDRFGNNGLKISNFTESDINFIRIKGVKDLAGNSVESTYLQDIYVKYDINPPNISSINIAKVGNKYIGSVSQDPKEVSGVDQSSLKYRYKGQTNWLNAPFEMPLETEGEFDFKISDNAGNETTFSQVLDKKKPVLTIMGLNSWYKDGDVITVNATDFSTIDPSNWTIQSSDPRASITEISKSNNKVTFTIKNLVQPESVLKVSLYDEFNNIVHREYSVNIDREAPIINSIEFRNLLTDEIVHTKALNQLHIMYDTPWLNIDNKVKINYSDNLSVKDDIIVKYSINGSLFTEYKNFIAVVSTFLSEENEIIIRTTDQAGNTRDFKLNVLVDKQIPNIITDLALESSVSKDIFYIKTLPLIDNTNTKSITKKAELSNLKYHLSKTKESTIPLDSDLWLEFNVDHNGIGYFSSNLDGEIYLHCKYTDPAGNSVLFNGEKIIVDNDGPYVSSVGSLENIYLKESKVKLNTLPEWFDIGTNSSNVVNLSYSISDSKINSSQVLQWNPLNLDNPEIVSNYVEPGVYYIYFQAQDHLGNIGSSIDENKFLTFIIDNEDPVVGSLESYKLIDNNLVLIPSGDYSPNRTVHLKPIATDNGKIDSYEIYRSDKTDGEYIRVNSKKNGNYLEVELFNGINYLKCFALDMAGNKSVEEVLYPVIIDSKPPTNLKVISKTHPYAIDHRYAVSNSSAAFLLSSNTGASGLKNYIYYLYKGLPGKETLVADYPKYTGINGSDRSRIVLTDLDDNFGDTATDQYGYYYLRVSPVAGNGLVGDEIEYRFRIDTTPPNKLTINSSTHPIERVLNGDLNYYNTTNAVFTWEEPRDLTGIDSYYYKFLNSKNISEAEIENLKTRISQGNHDLVSDDFITLSHRELNFDITSILDDPDAKSGSAYLVLAAKDWAGEIQSDYKLVSFDIELPELTNFEISTVKYSSGSNTFDIRTKWDKPIDKISGVSRQEISLQKYDEQLESFIQVYPASSNNEEIYKDVPLDENSQKIYGLTMEGAKYKFLVRVFDEADNILEYNYFFDEEGVEISASSFSIPFDNYFYGYRVKGQTLSNSWAELHLPETIEIVKNGSKVTKLNLNIGDKPINIFTSGKFIDVDSLLSFKVNGFDLQSKGVELNSSGLSFIDISLALSGDNFRNSSYGSLSRFNYLDFTGNSYIISPNYLGIQDTSFSSISGINLFNSSNGWEFSSENDLEFKISSKDLVLNKANLPYNDNLKFYNDNGRVYARNIVINSKWIVQGAEIDSNYSNPLFIETDKLKLKAQNCILRNDYVLVEEGEFIITNKDLSTSTIKVKNLIINNKGEFLKGNKFDFTKFNFQEGDSHFYVDSIDFNEFGLVLGGSISISGEDAKYQNQILNKSGIDKNNKGQITDSITLNDFGGVTLTAYNSELQGDLIIIKECLVTLGDQLTGDTNLTYSNNIEPLVIKASDISIIKDGSWTIENGLTINSGYGDGLELVNIGFRKNLEATEVYFPEIEIDLKEHIKGDTLKLRNLRLRRDKTLGESDKLENHSINVGEFNYTANGLKFVENMITVDNLILNSNTKYLDDTVFKNFSFNGTSIINYGVSSKEAYFSSDNWSFKATDFTMNNVSIESKAQIELPEKLGGKKIEFNKLLFSNDGSFEVLKNDQPQYLYIGGWRVLANGISIINSNLHIDNGTISLYSNMGGTDLIFSDLKLTPDGNIVDLELQENIVDKNFTSTNGYKVNSTGFILSNEGIRFKGNVILPDLMQNGEGNLSLDYNDYDILLRPNGKILTLSPKERLTYYYAGFYIEGFDAVINESNLTIGNNNLDVQNILDCNLGSIEFFPNGEIKEGGYTDNGITLDPFNGEISFTVKSIGITKEGVNLKSFVTLPRGFAIEEMFFDSLTLHSDGSITSDIAVPKLSFNKSDVSFDFEDIYLNGDGFSIGYGKIVLPDSMENKSVELTNFNITKEGDFELENAYIDPFELWGYTFYIDSLGYANDIISFDGGVRLSSEFPINELKSRKFNINKLNISLETNDVEFEISNSEDIEFMLFNKWNSVIETVSIDSDLKIKITRGWVELPSEFSSLGDEKPKLAINDILIDPANNDYDVRSVTGENLSYSFGGLDFAIKSVELSHERGMDITEGSVHIPENDPLDPKFPDGLDNITLFIDKFQITNDFEVGDFEVSASINQRTEILDGLFYIESNSNDPNADGWVVALSKTDKKLELGFSGTLALGYRFMDGIRGQKIDIGNESEEFGILVDISTGELKRFNASGDFRDPTTGVGLEYQLFNNSMETGEISVNYNSLDDEFSLEIYDTSLTLDSPDIPDFLQSKVITLNEFIINQSGDIESFDMDLLLPGRQEMFNNSSVYIENWRIGAQVIEAEDKFLFYIKENGDNGNILELGENFPEGLSGTSTKINQFSIDSNGNFGDFNMDITLSENLKLFNNLALKGINSDGSVNNSEGASLSFVTDSSGKGLDIEVSGTGILDQSLPEGLSGLEIPIETFVINTSGEIVEFNMGIANFNRKIFDAIDIESGSLNASYDSNYPDEVIFNVSGDIILPEEVKNGLSGLEKFTIETLEISTNSGITDFNASAQGDMEYDLYAGMTFTFTEVGLSENGIELDGELFLPQSLIKFSDASIDLNNFRMNWQGEITNIDAGLSAENVEFSGFRASISNFTIGTDKVSIDELEIQIPDLANIPIPELKFTNAGVDYNGNFYGDCEISRLETPEIAGFKLLFDNPGLDIDSKEITFDKVGTSIPDLVGGMEIELDGVKINSNGISITGGYFGLGSFVIADKVGFEDVYVQFQIDGNEYEVAGHGKMFLPVGSSSLEADLAFKTPTGDNPLGIKRVHLEWHATEGGIPIAQGVYINGLNLGVATGSPDEVPEQVRSLFDDGWRIQAGASISGETSDQFQCSGDIWMDFQGLAVAIQGNTIAMNDMLETTLTAALSELGLRANFVVSVSVIEGSVTVEVFEYDGRTLISGYGDVDFVIKKGKIVNKRVGPVRVKFPTKETRFNGPEVEAGRFSTNNGDKEGIKGSIKTPIGRYSVFVDTNGSIKFKGVNSYELYTIDNTQNRSYARSVSPMSNILSLDNSTSVIGGKTQYFTIDNLDKNTQISVLIAYQEGDPVGVLTSPSGKIFKTSGNEYEVYRESSLLIYSIPEPEIGQWKVQVENMPSDDSYQILVFGDVESGSVSIQPIGSFLKPVSRSFSLRGETTGYSNRPFKIKASKDRDSYSGYIIGDGVVSNDGSFNMNIDPSLILDGESFIFIDIDGGELPNGKVYSDGSVYINNENNKLPGVTNLLAYKNENKVLSVNFSPVKNNIRVKDYIVSVYNHKNELVKEANFGTSSNGDINGLDLTKSHTIMVVPRDRNNVSGVATTAQFYSSLSRNINTPKIVNSINISTYPGEEISRDFTVELDNFQLSDTAEGYIAYEINKSDSFSFRLKDSVVKASGNNIANDLILYTNRDTDPGIYILDLNVYNLGNTEIKETIECTIEVKEPLVIIEEVYPKEWDMIGSESFEILGSGFTKGVKVFVNEIEIPTFERKLDKIIANIPNGIQNGPATVRVEKGSSSEYGVEVNGPSWNIYSYKNYGEVLAGSLSTYFFKVNGENGFSGQVPMTLRGLPDGWESSWDSISIREGEINQLTVKPPESALPGNYNLELVDSKNNILPIVLLVKEDNIDPWISSLSEFSIIPGEEITLFGYGFDEIGDVYIDNKSQEIISWSNDKIVIKTSPNITKGDIYINTGEKRSNTITLSVKTRGFNIYPGVEEIRLQPGEGYKLPIVATGMSNFVNLSVENSSEYLTTYFDESQITLNGSTILNIDTQSNIPNGRYLLNIIGEDGYSLLNKSITILIGNSFEFVTDTIPAFMEGVDSSFELESRYGEGDVEFSLHNGYTLPRGLNLSTKGVISGKVFHGETSKAIKVDATDENDRIISKEFHIPIIENSWSIQSRDGGNTSYNPVMTPSESSKKWSRELNSEAKAIISGGKRVFVLTESNITVMDLRSGIVIKRIEGAFSDIFHLKETLFTVDSNNELTAWNYDLGIKKWFREDIINYSTDLNRLIVQDSVNTKYLNPEDGQYMEESQFDLPEQSLWINGELVSLDHLGLTSNIYDYTSDGKYLYVTTEEGELFVLDKKLQIAKNIEFLIYKPNISLGDNSLILYRDGDYIIINKETLEEKYRISSYIGKVISSLEKFFIVGDGGIEARNLATGSIIWEESNALSDAIIVGNEIFTSGVNGKITSYNGRHSIEAPTTTIKVTPESEDGVNNYYITTPTIEIITNDRESYCEEVLYRFNTLEYKKYDKPFTVPDGEYYLESYSKDTHGLISPIVSETLRIDSKPPETSANRDHTVSEEGYVNSIGKYVISSWDETSGVKDTYYELDGIKQKYSSPIVISEEGQHTISWWSTDHAGNVEQAKGETINIDLYPPEVESESYSMDRESYIYLTASDISGIDRIEYRINGSDVVEYIDPIILEHGAKYNLLFRAIDNAGRVSDWINEVYNLDNQSNAYLIKDFTVKWGQGRDIDRDLQVGNSIYASPNQYYKIAKLPEYLIGGELIISRYNDKHSWEKNFYNFTAGDNIDLYIVKNSKSRLRLDNSWNVIETGVKLSNSSSSGSGTVYHKSILKGSEVTIGGTAMWESGGPNLIIAKRSLTSALNIFSPMPDKILFPNSKIWYAATPIPGEKTRVWAYRINNDKWNNIGDSFSGELILPHIDKKATIDLKVEVTLFNDKKLETIRTYSIKNLAGVKVLEPVTGSQVIKGKTSKIEYISTDYKGDIVLNKVNFTSTNGNVFNDYIIPDRSGLFEIGWGNGSNSLMLNSVDRFLPEEFLFDLNLTKEFSKKTDGRNYGFSQNNKGRVGETTYVIVPEWESWSKIKETRKYIAMKEGNNFEYLVNNGIYKVEITTGPISRRDYSYISIEGERVSIPATRRRKIYTIETAVNVVDNKLTISASNNFPIISMKVLRDSSLISTNVKSNETLRIIKDMKWYLWNKDHYYSKDLEKDNKRIKGEIDD